MTVIELQKKRDRVQKAYESGAISSYVRRMERIGIVIKLKQIRSNNPKGMYR